MISEWRVRAREWLEPAKEQERKKRAVQITIAVAIAAALLILAAFCFYLGVIVGFFVDGFRIAT